MPWAPVILVATTPHMAVMVAMIAAEAGAETHELGTGLSDGAADRSLSRGGECDGASEDRERSGDSKGLLNGRVRWRGCFRR